MREYVDDLRLTINAPGDYFCMTRLHLLIWTLALSVLITCTASSQVKVPRFEDYRENAVFKGRNHPVVLTQESRQFRTRIRDASRRKPNFAGHYIVETWGCGTSCVMGAVIDASTGNVYMLPFTVCCWENYTDDFEPIQFRPNSRLIIFNGARDEKEGDAISHYYKFENNKFIQLDSAKKTRE
jgi:hypothetical protein